MSDLIRREDALKAAEQAELDAEFVKEALNNIPSVDTVEIVRCRDCVHRPYVPEGKKYITTDDDTELCPFVCDDSWYSSLVPDDGFCHLGERREQP